nr:unnamed protein product [Callosobruchus chinensis]
MDAANERSVKPCESKYTTPRILAIFYSFAFQKKESSLAAVVVGRWVLFFAFAGFNHREWTERTFFVSLWIFDRKICCYYVKFVIIYSFPRNLLTWVQHTILLTEVKYQNVLSDVETGT